MSEFSSRVDKLLVEKKLRRADMVRATGIPEGSIRQWARNESLPPVDRVFQVAEFLGVSMEFLVYGIEPPKTEDLKLDESEIELINLFRILDERDKNDLLEILKMKAARYSVATERNISVS